MDIPPSGWRTSSHSHSSASITGEKTVEALGDELLKYICRVCDGELVKAEINGISDMAIDQMGSYC